MRAAWECSVGRRLAERGEWDDGAAVHVVVPSGMGDFHWIWCKLRGWALGSGRRVKFWTAAGETTGAGLRPVRRAAEYAALCGAVAEHDAGVRTESVWAAPGSPVLPERGLVVVQANRHLERGLGLESWYPELPLQHHYPLQIPAGAHATAAALLGGTSGRCIAFFTGGARYMGGQQEPEEWQRLVAAVLATWEDATAVFLGAGGDVPHTLAAAAAVPPERRVLVLNQPVAVLVAVLQRCRALVGVAGGPGIVGTAFRLPAALYYPEHLERMPGTWEPPQMLAEGLCPWGLLKEMPRCRERIFPMLQRALK